LVTVVGAGGSGKTTVAIAAAEQGCAVLGAEEAEACADLRAAAALCEEL